MGMRRRAWCCVLAAVCVSAGLGACATSAGARGGGSTSKDAAGATAPSPAEGTTESLIAQSAEGLDRVLSGKQKRDANGHVAEPAHQDAPDTGAANAQTTAQAPSSPDREAPARSADPAVQPSAPASTAATTTTVPAAPSVAAPVTTPAPGQSGVLSGWWEPGTGASVEGQGASPANGAKAAAPGGGAGGAFWHGAGGDDAAQLRISQLALCTRVEGFGKVVKVESVRATGRAVPLLIYTQVDGFSCREQRREGGSGENDWIIELGQSVVVYRLSPDGKGDVQVKVEPEQTARDVSAFKRRDHYLVQRIELPTPLVSGRYAVKVTVRDKRTGMVDEKMSEVVVR
ncbi:MAG: hypothetical protein QM783_20020 [Phycisphaerales bacterium]